MPDGSPQHAWVGARETPVNLSLTDYVRGREIIQVEHEVDAHWHGRLRLRFRGPTSPQLLIQPVQPEAGTAHPGQVEWALKFAGGFTPRIWTPNRTMLGDGSVTVRDHQRLVGLTLEGIDTGARSGPLAVARLRFRETGFAALVLPQPLPFALQLSVQCVVMVRLYFLDVIRRDDTIPSTPGESLLE